MRPLTEHDREIRGAVAGGEFARARELWPGYCASLKAAIESGAATAEDMRELEELVSWARRTALCAQALASDQLFQIAVRRRYRAEEPRRAPLLSLVG